MFHVITIKDGRITGRHESMMPITAETFAGSPTFGGQTVQEVDPATEYSAGLMLAEYTADGVLRPLVDRINDGLAEIPTGYELIDGALVETQVPEAEAPPTLLARVQAAEQAAANSRAEEAQATRVVFRALAQTDVIKPADALDNAGMFPVWADCIGQRAEAGNYWRHGDKLYRVNAGQGHTIQADWAPDKAVSLFSLAANPADEWPEYIPVTGAHNIYYRGAKATYQGDRWILDAKTSAHAPGVVPGQWIKQP